MPFASIVGHDAPKKVLQRAIRSGRVSHAYLFEGPPNVGKTLTAKTFAQALVCDAPPSPGEGCGECPLCRAIDREHHPDFLLLRPKTRIELKDDEGQRERVEIAGTLIAVEDVDRLIMRAHSRTVQAPRKVFIISSAEAMNVYSANRLLKTLEEPPGQSVIILVSSSPSDLLPTIISRCQLVRFRPVPLPEMSAALEALFPAVEPEVVRSFAALSGGRFGWAHEMLTHSETREVRRELLDLLVAFPSRPAVYCLKAAEWFTEAIERWWRATEESHHADRLLKESRDRVLRTKIGDLLDLLLTWFRDLALAREDGVGGLLVNADRAGELAAAARTVPPGGPALAAAAVRRAKEAVRGNANLRLTLEVMLSEVWFALREPARG